MRAFQVLSLLLILNVSPPVVAESAAQSAKSDALKVTIDATKPRHQINPFIYGQFIEHLGRCIYGGIWAEMLEDRKFFFPITDDYRPYYDLKDTQFPVVSASPWEVLGPKGSVTMVKEDAFVGEHSPRVAAGSGIRQNDLGLVKDKDYRGSIWLRSTKDPATVTITLKGDGGTGQPKAADFKISDEDFQRHEFSFTAKQTTDKGRLEIRVGDNPVDIGAISLMPEDNVGGFRQDTLALLKQLNATIYRWPGGNFVSGYNWRDGIGLRDLRPPRHNPAWTGVEHNDVGIDEFVRLCQLIGAQPMIAVNTGFGDDYSAAQEVEYANGDENTIGGSWRIESGRDEPYDVKYWCVGNEMWGPWQLGHMSLAQYTQKHNRVAEAMHRVDPKLVLVGSGDLGTQDSLGDGKNARHVGWSEGMLEKCADHMDLISEHFYCGRLPWTKNGELPLVDHVGLIRAEIRKKADSHRALQAKLGRSPDKFIPIAMDEWNYWHRDYVYGELGCQYNLADALGIAAGLHEYFRNSDIVQMASYAQTVNVIGCVKTTKTAAFFDTTALPLLLYRREFGSQPLTVSGNQDERSVDVAAAKTDDGNAITIGVVNPQATSQSINVTVEGATLASTANVWRIAGDNPEAINTADKQAVSIAEEKDVPFAGSVKVPAYSVNIFRVPIK